MIQLFEFTRRNTKISVKRSYGNLVLYDKLLKVNDEYITKTTHKVGLSQFLNKTCKRIYKKVKHVKILLKIWYIYKTTMVGP